MNTFIIRTFLRNDNMVGFNYLLKSLEPFFIFVLIGYIAIELLKFQIEMKKKKK